MNELQISRYTDLPSLIHILKNRQLTLLNPSTWDDRNDSSFIDFYKEKCCLRSVLALCFTRASETYHHWRIFSPGSAGVRITFDETNLLCSLKEKPEFRFRNVEYLKIRDIRNTSLDRNQLPFIKRHPYKPEHEARLLWESNTEHKDWIGLPIDIDSITQITLSPWLNKDLSDCIKSTLKNIAGCDNLKIYRTTLLNNNDWLTQGRSAS